MKRHLISLAILAIMPIVASAAVPRDQADTIRENAQTISALWAQIDLLHYELGFNQKKAYAPEAPQSQPAAATAPSTAKSLPGSADQSVSQVGDTVSQPQKRGGIFGKSTNNNPNKPQIR